MFSEATFDSLQLFCSSSLGKSATLPSQHIISDFLKNPILRARYEEIPHVSPSVNSGNCPEHFFSNSGTGKDDTFERWNFLGWKAVLLVWKALLSAAHPTYQLQLNWTPLFRLFSPLSSFAATFRVFIIFEPQLHPPCSEILLCLGVGGFSSSCLADTYERGCGPSIMDRTWPEACIYNKENGCRLNTGIILSWRNGVLNL